VLTQCWFSATLDLSLANLLRSDLSLSDFRFVDLLQVVDVCKLLFYPTRAKAGISAS
jgi:hypothetical protein